MNSLSIVYKVKMNGYAGAFSIERGGNTSIATMLIFYSRVLF